MAPRTRKPPEKKKPASAAKRRAAPRRSLALRTVAFAASLAARNPTIFGGSAAFAVVFGFVAANALWYQPGSHPHPLLRTRLPFTHPDPANLGRPGENEPQKVTTFVIEREDEAQGDTVGTQPTAERTASLPPARLAAPKAAPEAAPERPLVDAADTGDPTALITAIQTELTRRGLYEGPADGRIGPKTTAAITQFERRAGRSTTGQATPALLSALRVDGRKDRPRLVSATPSERPYGETAAPTKGDLDPVAAAIRAADIDAQTTPRADIPAASELVMTIQRGLANLAYTDVRIDGVAGEQTRAAIRDFEKHYRLPETGEPGPAVVRKMKEIGAL